MLAVRTQRAHYRMRNNSHSVSNSWVKANLNCLDFSGNQSTDMFAEVGLRRLQLPNSPEHVFSELLGNRCYCLSVCSEYVSELNITSNNGILNEVSLLLQKNREVPAAFSAFCYSMNTNVVTKSCLLTHPAVTAAASEKRVTYMVLHCSYCVQMSKWHISKLKCYISVTIYYFLFGAMFVSTWWK